MNLPSRGSVTGWLVELKEGHESAAQELWNRYLAELMSLARHRLHGLACETDEEDIALSALKSAMLGVRNNQFPDLHDRTSLWPLLVTITARKAINVIKRQSMKKRDRALEVRDADVESFVGTAPSAEFAIQLIEVIERLLLCSVNERPKANSLVELNP